MLKIILISLAVLVVGFLVVAALQPAAYRVERSASIPAPASVVFDQVNDLRRFQTWSPWAKLDPAATMTFEGPASGVGAATTWVGNSEVGEGTMTITESRPSEFVSFRLDFKKPFTGTSLAHFAFQPLGDQTAVTWSITGEKNFICKAMGLFVSMDKMCGTQFEKGLADLKKESVAAAQQSQLLTNTR